MADSTNSTVDYNRPDYWAALPDRSDSADLVPAVSLQDGQISAQVDVFFIHPTTYTGDRGHDQWNASLDDNELNLKTDETTIRHQASIFNAQARVYAPRYRQAHLYAYRARGQATQAARAFEVAYHDVKEAFLHYLSNWNKGRPFIIAAHSQGTQHAVRLMQELIDTTELGERLIAAYLVGMPVLKRSFIQIPPCEAPSQTGCFCSWRTFRQGYLPKKYPTGDSIAVTNPLSWRTDSRRIDRNENAGSVLRKFYNGLQIHLVGAQIHEGILWAEKPRFPGSFLITFRNYHIADYNLYYASVRQNVQDRIASYFEQTTSSSH